MTKTALPLKLTGLYLLTDDGELGVFDDGNALTIDAALSKAFLLHNRRLLEAYTGDPDAGLRVAVLYHATQPRAWGHDTLRLEESVVRDLYPVAGRGGAPLTMFQQKNREKSIYRGLELLLDYRKETEPRAPIYCPVLYDRRTLLGQYPSLPADTAEPRQLPVIEVLNLVGTIPIGRRDVSAVHGLMQTLSARLIRKELRRSRLAIDERTVTTPTADGTGGYAADRRAERAPTLVADGGNPYWGAPPQTPAAVPPAQMARWLKQPQGKPDATLLQSFAQFRVMSAEVLQALASQLLIHAAPAGVQLLNRDSTDEWNMYLIAGKVALDPGDGARVFIEGGSTNAAAPIASLKPRKYTVTTVTPIRFLWIPDSLLAVARASAPAFKSDR
ncbi:MAG: hypothetical protein ACLGHO_00195 [Gammaproteobacteria bacterium]